QAWREAPRYDDGRATVAGWLVMLTRARSIDRIRARGSRPDVESPVAIDDARPSWTCVRDGRAGRAVHGRQPAGAARRSHLPGVGGRRGKRTRRRRTVQRG